MREVLRVWIICGVFMVACAVICGSSCPGNGTPWGGGSSVTATSVTTGGGTTATTTGGTTGTTFDPSTSTGHYTGQWVDSTLGVSGPATMDITVTPTNQMATVTIDAGPNLFGEGDPPSDTFTGSYSNAGVSFSGVSNKFGNVTLTISPTGAVNGNATNVNSSVVDRFTFTGTATSTQLSLNMNVHLINGSSHTGTVTLNKN